MDNPKTRVFWFNPVNAFVVAGGENGGSSDTKQD